MHPIQDAGYWKHEVGARIARPYEKKNCIG